MKSSAYLWRHRHGTYYFRVKVPVYLRDALGRKEIRKSLKTDSLKQALLHARLLRVQFDLMVKKMGFGFDDRIAGYMQLGSIKIDTGDNDRDVEDLLRLLGTLSEEERRAVLQGHIVTQNSLTRIKSWTQAA